MTHPNAATALASVVVDELVRSGVDYVAIAPGSRSTALVLAVTDRPEIHATVFLDERSAGFGALGFAKATGRPGAVVTTSGTAVANLLPAVVEADASGARLVVISGDRPQELRHVGANQTIDQAGIFGRFVRVTVELDGDGPPVDQSSYWRSEVSRAIGFGAGWGARSGPIHLNIAFREPTVPMSDDGRTVGSPYDQATEGRPGGAPWTSVLPSAAPADVSAVASRLSSVEHGIVVAGSGAGHPAILELGRHLGWPVLATAESGLRRVGGIATGHHLLEDGPKPEVVLRFGSPGPSRRVVTLATGRAFQVVVGDGWSDPGRRADVLVSGDPGVVAKMLTETIDPDRDDGWMEWWNRSNEAAVEAITTEIGATIEPAVAHSLDKAGADLLTVASSMPIRDVDAYCLAAPPVVANRGASGIDGFVSTALGVAASGARSVAFAGDLSMFYDGNGFSCSPRPDLVFVVVDNEGGGIFSFLPQAEHVDHDRFERLFGTPPRRSFERFAAFHEVGLFESTPADVAGAVSTARAAGGVNLVVVKSSRESNVGEHRALDAEIGRAIRRVGPFG